MGEFGGAFRVTGLVAVFCSGLVIGGCGLTDVQVSNIKPQKQMTHVISMVDWSPDGCDVDDIKGYLAAPGKFSGDATTAILTGYWREIDQMVTPGIFWNCVETHTERSAMRGLVRFNLKEIPAKFAAATLTFRAWTKRPDTSTGSWPKLASINQATSVTWLGGAEKLSDTHWFRTGEYSTIKGKNPTENGDLSFAGGAGAPVVAKFPSSKDKIAESNVNYVDGEFRINVTSVVKGWKAGSGNTGTGFVFIGPVETFGQPSAGEGEYALIYDVQLRIVHNPSAGKKL